MLVFYTGTVLLPCGFLLPFDVLRGALVQCHLGLCVPTLWGGRIGAHTGWNVMSPCGSNLKGGAGAAYIVVYGVCTLGGGVTCGGWPW